MKFATKWSFLFPILIVFPHLLSAQSDGVIIARADTPPPVSASSAAPAEEAPAPEGKFTFSGYFDTYYFANLNNPSTRSNLGSSGISRGFDRYSGQFQLGMFLTRMSYAYGNTEVVGEVGYGPNVEYGSYGNEIGRAHV